MNDTKHLSRDELHAGLPHLLAAPKELGTVDLIVCRPAVDAREVLTAGRLDVELGLAGDRWHDHPSADPAVQLTLMNSRVIDLVAVNRERWPLAGDQLYVDLELAEENLPPGSRLRIGDALIEVSTAPHTGCNKFADRFGVAATQFVNSKQGRAHNFRGINARVIHGGAIRKGDAIQVESRMQQRTAVR